MYAGGGEKPLREPSSAARAINQRAWSLGISAVVTTPWRGRRFTNSRKERRESASASMASTPLTSEMTACTTSTPARVGRDHHTARSPYASIELA